MGMEMGLTEFKLGVFSIAGCPSFVGMVIGEQVMAMSRLERLARELKTPLGNSATMLDMLDDWERNSAALQALADALSSRYSPLWREESVPLAQLKLHAPVSARQVFCTISNFCSGAIEVALDGAGSDGEPDAIRRQVIEQVDQRRQTGEPYVCAKLPSSIIGPEDSITIPPYTQQADWEAELAVVIGKTAYNVSSADALNYVAGYTVANDITVRDLIARSDTPFGTDWLKSKCSPGYLPLGPFITPREFIGDVDKLVIRLHLNEACMQHEFVSDMVFGISEQIAYISKYVRLMPGDVICTGSPAGFGSHYNRFLQQGDCVSASVDGLGSQRNMIVRNQEQG